MLNLSISHTTANSQLLLSIQHLKQPQQPNQHPNNCTLYASSHLPSPRLKCTTLRTRSRQTLTRQNSITCNGRRTARRSTIRSPVCSLTRTSHGRWAGLDGYCATGEDAGAGRARSAGVGSVAVARPLVWVVSLYKERGKGRRRTVMV